MAKILIVEDERDIRELIEFTLRFAGIETVAVKDGQEAVDATRVEMPDLVLMDVRMPRMNGYQACEKIKADKNTAHIPVVFLSAKGQDVEVEQGFIAGATEYLLKPFSPHDLLECVQALLAKTSKGKKTISRD